MQEFRIFTDNSSVELCLPVSQRKEGLEERMMKSELQVKDRNKGNEGMLEYIQCRNAVVRALIPCIHTPLYFDIISDGLCFAFLALLPQYFMVES